MGRVLKLAVVLAAALALLALAASVLPRLVFSPGGSGSESVFGVEEERRYPVLATLNYALTGVREHAPRIWSMLREFDQGDPAVAPYLEWLVWALANIRTRPHVYGDYIVVDTPVDREVVTYLGKGALQVSYVPAKHGMLPANNSKVRMGFIRMPFGYGIIVTAYQDSDGQIIIVVHGTVVDEAEFLELAVRALAYPVIGVPPLISSMQVCMEPNATSECEEEIWHFKRRFNLTTYWFLWRTMLPGKEYLEVNETLRIPVREVYLLIEMPVLGASPAPPEQSAGSRIFGCLEMDDDLRAMVFDKFGTRCIDATMKFEPVYLALSHPVFGLASNFAEVGEREAFRLASYMVIYGPYYGFRTILTARLVGKAACEGASASTAMSASLFGYPAIVSRGRSWIHGGALHDISGYLRLSSMGEQGAVQLVVDVDGDGVLDSYDVLVDTAMLPMDNIRGEYTNITAYCPPLVCMNHAFASYAGVSMSLIGAPQVVLRAPEWLKTPVFIRYQWLTERLVSESLSNVAPIAEMRPFGTDWIYGYVYDEERNAFVPVGNRTYVYSIPSERFPLLVEPAIRVIFAEKGVGPGLFTPPSAQYVKPVVGNLPVLYEDREIPSTRRYLVEGFRRLAEERARQLEGYSPFVRPAEPVELEVVLEPVYVDVPVFMNGTERVVARAFDGWEATFTADYYTYAARLYRVSGDAFRLEVETVSGLYVRRWLDFEGLPPNGTRFEFETGGRRVVLTVYYKPAELELGVVEVPEDALTLYKEYEFTLPSGEVVTARLYVINATTLLGGPILIERRGGAVIMVYGSVGTLEAGVSVTVYGASSRTHYTAKAELVLPNGTAIQLNTTWWTPNPPVDRVITITTTTYDLPRMRLSGAVLKITIRELGLTVVIRIPE